MRRLGGRHCGVVLLLRNFVLREQRFEPVDILGGLDRICFRLTLASLCGVMLLLDYGTANPTDAGEMWELYAQVGFGQKPQIGFPGAVTGRLRPYKTWRPIEQATMSYGYGLSASLLQIAHAYTAFAHDGEVIPISLLKRPLEGPDSQIPGVRVFSPKTAQSVRDMLQLAAGPGGTGPKAQTMGYTVGGKSGTAYKQEGKGYATKKYRAWFVGLAPISHPRIIVAVMVDEPSNGKHFGGDVAAPVFSQVVQQTLRTLGVAPDLEVKTQIITKDIPAEEESF